jgi:hypothetical protein
MLGALTLLVKVQTVVSPEVTEMLDTVLPDLVPVGVGFGVV